MNERTGAVILAAGESHISKIPMVKRELDILREAGLSPIVVVAGHNEEEIRRHLVHRKVIFAVNPDYRTTRMFESIQLGLKALHTLCEKAVIVNGDAPAFSRKTLQALAESRYEVTFPMHDGKPGHPFCVSMAMAEKILAYDGGSGIQGMIKKGLIKAGLTEVDDPGIHLSAKEEESLKRILQYQQDIIEASSIRAEIRFSLARKESFFDEDTAALLREIQHCHSMNTACKNLNMAYSRGWKMIKNAEEMLGCPLITKQVGGSKGGGSVLTEAGSRYLENYENIREKIIAYADEVISGSFPPSGS